MSILELKQKHLKLHFRKASLLDDNNEHYVTGITVTGHSFLSSDLPSCPQTNADVDGTTSNQTMAVSFQILPNPLLP